MEERDKKKMDQLKKKLHTDDEGTCMCALYVMSKNDIISLVYCYLTSTEKNDVMF